MDHLSVDSGAPAASKVSKPEKAAPKLKRAAAKKKAIVLSDSEDVEDESLPSSASESDMASDSEDDFSPEKQPKAALAKKCVLALPSMLCSALDCEGVIPVPFLGMGRC